MSAPSPYFFRTPIRYLRWASHEKPAIFYASCIASMGPVFLIAVPPLRRRFGDDPRERIPLTYPSKWPYDIRCCTTGGSLYGAVAVKRTGELIDMR